MLLFTSTGTTFLLLLLLFSYYFLGTGQQPHDFGCKGRQPKNLGPAEDVEKTIGLGLVGRNGGGMEGNEINRVKYNDIMSD